MLLQQYLESRVLLAQLLPSTTRRRSAVKVNVHNWAATCGIYLEAVSVVCSKQISEIHPGQGGVWCSLWLQCSWEAAGRSSCQVGWAGGQQMIARITLYRVKCCSSYGDLHEFYFFCSRGEGFPSQVHSAVLLSPVLDGRGRRQLPEVLQQKCIANRGPDTAPFWSQWKLRGSRSGPVETRAIKQSEDINVYICMHIYIYMSLYLRVCMPILGPFVFRLIKPSCLQRKGGGADARVRSSCFKLLTHLSRASKGRDATSIQKFVKKNSGSPKQA